MADGAVAFSNDRILLLGATGSGKSSFVQAAVDGRSNEIITTKVKAYPTRTLSIRRGNQRCQRRLVLVDTPGLDGEFCNKNEAVKQVQALIPRDNTQLAGILYFHPISKTRKEWQRLNRLLYDFITSLDISRTVPIFLATSHWDNRPKDANARERELVRDLTTMFQDRMLYWAPIHISSFDGSYSPQDWEAIRDWITSTINCTPFVLLFGRTGAGKSTFVNLCFREELAEVGHGLKSMTKSAQIHYPRADKNICDYIVIDTPGYDDTWSLDAKAPVEIAKALSNLHPCAPGVVLYLVDESKYPYLDKKTEHGDRLLFRRIRELKPESIDVIKTPSSSGTSEDLQVLCNGLKTLNPTFPNLDPGVKMGETQSFCRSAGDFLLHRSNGSLTAKELISIINPPKRNKSPIRNASKPNRHHKQEKQNEKDKNSIWSKLRSFFS
ncbi:hypothetical protein FA15DRAFT_753555 [Coprinopsis marcescibilis]|uniref:G domain-containing protein n=1 Tax=Coprinopsis marcescibilis TaxID=230819 RepID=A0A5C3L7D1_COPMA|nr:hypothetical protein FA15DRAFT_753555 [Coprinopsis marcescibilis]